MLDSAVKSSTSKYTLQVLIPSQLSQQVHHHAY